MSKIRNGIERFFENLTRLIYHNRIKVLLVMSLIIVSLFGQVSNLVIDTSMEEMLHETDPHRVRYEQFKDQFGSSSLTLIMIKPPEVFGPSFITKLKSYHNDLENQVPYLHEITSLINVRSTRGEGDTLLVDDLLKGWPDEATDLEKIKSIALQNEFYKNNIISVDGKYTAIVVETKSKIQDEFDTGDALDGFEDESTSDSSSGTGEHSLSPKENAKINDAITELIHQYESPDFEISFTGGPVIVDVFNRSSDSDVKKLFVLITLIIILFLALLFRRITGILFPLIIVYSAMFSTLGLMVIFGTPISMMTTVIPSFLTAVGIADAVHVLTIFYRKLQETGDKEEAICYAVGHSGLAIVMTSLTTAAGLLSFAFAEISTISDMGVYASSGVILALVYTIILLPALIALAPIRKKKETTGRSVLMDRVLLFFAGFSTQHPIKIVSGCFLLFLVSLVFIFRLEISSNIINYFPDTHQVKTDLNEVEKHLEGTITVEVIVDTKKVNGVHDPSILNSIDKLSREIVKIKNKDIYVGKVFSITDIVKETNQALHANDKAYYSIPEKTATVAQELLLFENSGSDDLERITDSNFTKARVTIKTKWADSVAFRYFVADIEKMYNDEFEGRAEITVTGISALLARTIPAALHSMTRSYVVALIIITIFMLLLVGNIKMGLLSMCPNLLPIFMVMGLISLVGVKLDINTLFIGSIAIGLVVDDTIHFMYNFRKYYDLTGDPVKAVEETLLGAGRAMLITSVVLCGNFFILLTATMNHTVRFGLFTGIVTILALLADFILAPALMVLATRRVAEKSMEEDGNTLLATGS